jgi:menaquinone-specific isochorismate synthase
MKNGSRFELTSGAVVDPAGLLADMIADATGSLGSEATGSGIVRVEVEIEPIDPLHWLSAQQCDQKIFWRSREGNCEIAGAGAAEIFRLDKPNQFRSVLDRVQPDTVSGTDTPRYFGGFRFDPNEVERNSDSLWRPFGMGMFLLPRFEVIKEDDSCRLICNVTLATPGEKSLTRILDELDSLVFDPGTIEEAALSTCHREDEPSRHDWTKKIEDALRLFAADRIQKIVLARRISLEFRSQPNSWQILKHLREKSVNSYLFGFQPSTDTIFVGASPELLYHRRGRAVKSEALAGTRPRGVAAGEIPNGDDKRLEQELLRSDKDLREHRFVADSLEASLRTVCRDMTVDNRVSVRKLARLQHLVSSFRGTLRANVSDLDILKALHPTPAVGGYPEDAALREITRLESFDRGLFAGPIGWVGGDEAEFAVAIRSGLVSHNRLVLYSGAGIVEGSTPDDEWQEIDTKIDSFLSMMAGK